MKFNITKLLKNSTSFFALHGVEDTATIYAPLFKGRCHKVTERFYCLFIIAILVFGFSSEAFALKIKNFKNTKRNYTQQSDGSSELEYQVNKEQRLKEILNKYEKECDLIFVDRSPKVVFDALLQEVNNKFSKSLTYKDLLSNKDHLYFATNDWPSNELKKFNECKENMFGALLEAIKNHIK